MSNLLTPKAEARLRNPKPGSTIAQAAEFGVDLSLLVECLRLTPEDRLRRLQQQIAALEQIRGAGQRAGEHKHG